jgi:hypothetical protein
MRHFFIVLFALTGIFSTYAQPGNEVAPAEQQDTLVVEPIIFTAATASQYIIKLMEHEQLWRPSGDTMRLSLSRLIDHYHEPFDSVARRLSRFDYTVVDPQRLRITRRDTLPVRWLNDHLFIVDTLPLEKEPFLSRKTFVVSAVDTAVYSLLEKRIPEWEKKNEIRHLIDSLFHVRDTITEVFIDTLFLKSKNVVMHQIIDEEIVPPLMPPGSRKTAELMPDYSKVLITESSLHYIASRESPFYKVPDAMMPDSLRFAVETLLQHTDERDSILLFLTGADGRKLPFWLTTETDELYRYWIRNAENDSITIWIGNPSKYDITLMLEDDVYVERLDKIPADNIPITTLRPQRSMARLSPLEEIPVFWSHSLSSALTLNQTYLSNWARGGQSSLATIVDLRGAAAYTNTESKRKWENSGRLRYGSVITQEQGFRTNTDLVEVNSQYNRVIGEKIDFSSVLYMKTQVAKGFKYPNDSVVVSKFLNPGTFTVGTGIEYKPFKNTVLNFSVLSYRNTFVLDTANINQRAHGVDRDKRSRQEMGGQLVIKNTVSILDGLNISNNIRLFSNYLDKPQNIDVDWEINLDKRINWYFMVRLNFHFIYDDDIHFPVLDRDNNPVLLPDGSEKKVPMLQLKQFLGLTLSFRI